MTTEHMPAWPKELHVGSVHPDSCARDHALCDGPTAVAYVLGGGYPAGRGWAPGTAALAKEFERRWNAHDALVKALELVQRCPHAAPFLARMPSDPKAGYIGMNGACGNDSPSVWDCIDAALRLANGDAS